MKKKQLLELADHIETLHYRRWTIGGSRFGVSKRWPSDKQFSLLGWHFDCGMAACAGGHAAKLFPNIFPYGLTWTLTFADGFNISLEQASQICLPNHYESENPKPKTVANRIREIVENS